MSNLLFAQKEECKHTNAASNDRKATVVCHDDVRRSR
jgi:hypothetical protein